MSQHRADIDDVLPPIHSLTFFGAGGSPSSGASSAASSSVLSSVVRFLPRGFLSFGGAADEGGFAWLAILELLRVVVASSAAVSVSLVIVNKISN
jgi:hypothetical protein